MERIKMLKDYTIEDCLKAYEDGFVIICKDGKPAILSNMEEYTG
jgi:hypothetical protein